MTNSKYGKSATINFQPMPERFMVWDKHTKGFRFNDNDRTTVFDIPALIGFFLYQAQDCIPHTNFVLVQSTNLFDKDGEEIFELHIVRVGGETGVVQMVNGEWHAVGDDDISLSVWEPSGIEILGHTLSNPELLKEEMSKNIKKAFDIEHNYYELSPKPEDGYSTIIGALRGVIWYNGLEPCIRDVKQAIEKELRLHPNLDTRERENVGRPETEQCKDDQFEVIWMSLVQMFGDYGSSPRRGWINFDRLEDALCFVNMLLEEA